MGIMIRQTYEVITEESAAEGEAEERGFIDLAGYKYDVDNYDIPGEEVDFRQLIDLLAGGEASCCPVTANYASHTWVTHYGDQDMHDGSYENRSVHFADSPAKAKYWVKALRAAGHKIRN